MGNSTVTDVTFNAIKNIKMNIKRERKKALQVIFLVNTGVYSPIIYLVYIVNLVKFSSLFSKKCCVMDVTSNEPLFSGDIISLIIPMNFQIFLPKYQS